MGYIAPIIQVQYLQYRERMMKTRNTYKSPEVNAIPTMRLQPNLGRQSAMKHRSPHSQTVETDPEKLNGLGENINIYI